MTIFEGRNSVMRNALTQETVSAFHSCMDAPIVQNDEAGRSSSSQKELIVRELLASDFVQKFEMILSRKNDSISLIQKTESSILADEYSFTHDMSKESLEIEKSFQKSLNASFEGTSFESTLFRPSSRFHCSNFALS